MSDRPDAEFVTIAEAARRLSISDRQAHRLAGRLTDDDRQKADRGPTRVRLAALRALRPNDKESDTGQTHVRHEADTGGGTADQGRHAAGALVEHLKGEVDYLREALRNQQVLHLEGLRTANQRIAELETEKARLVAMLPAVPSRADGAEAVEASDTAAMMSDTGQTDVRHEADTGAHTSTEPTDATERPLGTQNGPESSNRAAKGKVPADPYANTGGGEDDPYANTVSPMDTTAAVTVAAPEKPEETTVQESPAEVHSPRSSGQSEPTGDHTEETQSARAAAARGVVAAAARKFAATEEAIRAQESAERLPWWKRWFGGGG